MREKLVAQVLAFILLFSGYTLTSPGVISNTNNNAPILGSTQYIERIQKVAKVSGNRSALSLIMIDVSKNGDQLDNNQSDNIKRFHKLVSSLIYKIGYVDIKTHYFRNQLNRAPKTLKQLMLINKNVSVNKRWILLNAINSGYHMQGVDGEYNLKFISYDDFYEAVYNKKGILLDEHNDPINMGTYNYAAGICSNKAHMKFDVDPYLIYGNTLNSTQKGKDNIDLGVKSAYLNYKEHAASVYIYRKKLFGMQKGRVE
ncbi:hypothetical protein [Clostridium akagii]|uniref:hypothetical protein n=1 Tax=Clostridium akagii TaxID=91623 RepID=UPI00047943F4|nr:hypothetical protein [Clostridium akagii]